MKKIDRNAVGSDGKRDSTHYGGADNPHETIKCLHAWGLENDALLWNTVKYISRAGKKGGSTMVRDLEKAHYYLGKRIEDLKNSTVPHLKEEVERLVRRGRPRSSRRSMSTKYLERRLKTLGVIPRKTRLRTNR
jgi:hypothetical protein